MNIYKSLEGVKVMPGMLVLDKDQARRRNHLLVKTKDSIASLKLSNAETELLADAEGLAVFKLINETNFKAGEIFGYDGELNKAKARCLVPAAQVLEAAEAAPEVEAEIDDDLVNAILSLESDNSAHFNQNTGKPELAMLKGLMNRNVTGKERDAAWNYILETEEDIEDEDLGEDETTDIESGQGDDAGFDEKNDLI